MKARTISALCGLALLSSCTAQDMAAFNYGWSHPYGYAPAYYSPYVASYYDGGVAANYARYEQSDMQDVKAALQAQQQEQAAQQMQQQYNTMLLQGPR